MSAADIPPDSTQWDHFIFAVERSALAGGDQHGPAA